MEERRCTYAEAFLAKKRKKGFNAYEAKKVMKGP
jgi:hypothetical protein